MFQNTVTDNSLLSQEFIAVKIVQKYLVLILDIISIVTKIVKEREHAAQEIKLNFVNFFYLIFLNKHDLLRFYNNKEEKVYVTIKTVYKINYTLQNGLNIPRLFEKM
jgi:hypothetical protein